jgi:hypothetical protein
MDSFKIGVLLGKITNDLLLHGKVTFASPSTSSKARASAPAASASTGSWMARVLTSVLAVLQEDMRTIG